MGCKCKCDLCNDEISEERCNLLRISDYGLSVLYGMDFYKEINKRHIVLCPNCLKSHSFPITERTVKFDHGSWYRSNLLVKLRLDYNISDALAVQLFKKLDKVTKFSLTEIPFNKVAYIKHLL